MSLRVLQNSSNNYGADFSIEINDNIVYRLYIGADDDGNLTISLIDTVNGMTTLELSEMIPDEDGIHNRYILSRVLTGDRLGMEVIADELEIGRNSILQEFTNRNIASFYQAVRSIAPQPANTSSWRDAIRFTNPIITTADITPGTTIDITAQPVSSATGESIGGESIGQITNVRGRRQPSIPADIFEEHEDEEDS